MRIARMRFKALPPTRSARSCARPDDVAAEVLDGRRELRGEGDVEFARPRQRVLVGDDDPARARGHHEDRVVVRATLPRSMRGFPLSE